MDSAVCSSSKIGATSGKEILHTQMLGEHCMINMHITYEHQLIIISHFQNEKNFAGMMSAFFFINKVYNKVKKQNGES